MLEHVTRLKEFSVETHYINSSPDIIRVIKLRRGNWAGQLHVGNLPTGCFVKIKYRT